MVSISCHTDQLQPTVLPNESLSLSETRSQRSDEECLHPMLLSADGASCESASCEIDAILKRYLEEVPLFANVPAKMIGKVCEQAEWIEVDRGVTICEQDADGDSMFVLIEGRVRVMQRNSTGNRLLRHLESGDHFGEMSVLTGERRTASIVADTPVRLMRIGRNTFELLRQNAPNFNNALSRTLAVRLASTMNDSGTECKHRQIGVIVNCEKGFQMANRLIAEMRARGLQVRVQSETVDDQMTQNGVSMATCCVSIQRLGEVNSTIGRSERISQLRRCEYLLHFCSSSADDHNDEQLNTWLAAAPQLRRRLHRVEMIPEGQRFGRQRFVGSHSGGHRNFILPVRSDAQNREMRQGFGRIIRFLLDQRIGIALSGGGARGLAHLGVLQAFEDAGVDVDLVSGTSMGALIGLSYAAGFSPVEAEQLFRHELTPAWPLRTMPGGSLLYLLSKFRFNGWESMLRQFFEQASFAQLQIPLATVSADLIAGTEVIRESGDAIHAILESINLPIIARPIVRDGCVLVDGGVLNNVPADLLRPRGASFVIGVDVCAALPTGLARFGRHRKSSRSPWVWQTTSRLDQIRRYRVSQSAAPQADQIIRVNASGFAFGDFSKSQELADVGYEAATDIAKDIRRLLDRRIEA